MSCQNSAENFFVKGGTKLPQQKAYSNSRVTRLARQCNIAASVVKPHEVSMRTPYERFLKLLSTPDYLGKVTILYRLLLMKSRKSLHETRQIA